MDPLTQRWRWVARFSILAAFACMWIECLSFSQLSQQADDSTNPTTQLPLSATALRVSQVASVVSSVILIGGIILGVLGIAAGRRRRESETAMIAAIGLVLNLAIVGLAVWFLSTLSSARG